MARYAKISVLSQPQLAFPTFSTSPEELFKRMVPHLKAHLDNALRDKPDLIVLPEACDRYYNMPLPERIQYYRYRGNKILDFYREQAKQHHCYIAYSACREVCREAELPFRNSTQIIGRDGNVVGIYDKNHLVPAELEEGKIAYGTEAPIFELDFGRVGCAICFDLNYDELLYRYVEQKPELILFSSMYHGGMVQEKWALTCRSYFAGAIHNKKSRILNPVGEELAHTSDGFWYATQKINLDYAMVHLDHNYFGENKLAAVKEKYGDLFVIHNPDHLGYVMISYEGTDRTIMDIVKEFKLTLLDDYFNNCRTHRNTHMNHY